MNLRAVYDTMLFFQWAALGQNRQHATTRALYDGSIQLLMSDALFEEVREVLSRPALRAKTPNLTDDRLAEIFDEITGLAEWVTDGTSAFHWPQHPDDDHIFNLAIASQADLLVTWESRIQKLSTEDTPDADRLRILAPRLKIVTPPQLAALLKLT